LAIEEQDVAEEIEPSRQKPEEDDPILRTLGKAAENIKKFGESLEKIEESIKYFVAETIPRFLDATLQRIKQFGETLKGYFQPLFKSIGQILSTLWNDIITLPFVWPFIILFLVGLFFKMWWLTVIGAGCLGLILCVGFILTIKSK